MLGRKILVVDDEDHICRVVALKLRSAGYRVTTAADAEQAIQAAQVERPDLIITDYQMPGLSGVELCRAMEDSFTPHIPSILLTARAYDLGGRNPHPLSLKRVMSKPFSPRHLVATVRELLEEAA